MKHTTLWLTAALLLAGCAGPSVSMRPGPSFKRYEQSDGLKLITASGVRVKAREVENYPVADLPFWQDALERHLVERGYVLASKDEFRTEGGLPGATLDFVVPHGAEDWVLSETLFVVGDRVVLVEAAGPFALFEPVRAELRASLRTFDPGS
jgi:hypothetical protein